MMKFDKFFKYNLMKIWRIEHFVKSMFNVWKNGNLQLDILKVANKNKYIFDQYRIKQNKNVTTNFEYTWHKRPKILVEPFLRI